MAFAEGAGALRTVSPSFVIRRWQGRADPASATALARSAGAGLAVFALQQSAHWGWTDRLTVGALVVAVALLVAFVIVERRTSAPLIDVSAFADRSFRVQNVVLFAAMIVFVPVFFFASQYGQVALGQTPSEASLLLLYFFAGFVVAGQVGGRLLDRGGAPRSAGLGGGSSDAAVPMMRVNVRLPAR